jgi:anaerobic ribonucleoside-triphosphate reductase activating protein
MGGDSDPIEISDLAAFIKLRYPNLKVGWYSGNKEISPLIKTDWFDYIKVGPYIKELGGLDNPNTNQKFYAKGKYLHKMDANSEMFYDVTYKFWKHES